VTYSIVARDADSGALGVAVQSHFLAVGAHVTWGLTGVGVVATQATALSRFGSRGLELMAAGATASEALQTCLAEDGAAQTRQVGMLDAGGGVAAHTGSRCWRLNAHELGDGVAAQANMVASAEIPAAMVHAFEESDGDLGGRLLDALEAAEHLGGDLRGRQSAALLIVGGEPTDDPGEGVLTDLRVDDHLEPLIELRRVHAIHRAFEPMLAAMRGPACRGGTPATPAELEAALSTFLSAQTVYGPENLEPTFWRAVALHRAGCGEEVALLLAELRAANPGWETLFAHVVNP
jgi:uncharacterized Ntn-hydrolase superfamily protein